MRLEKKKCCGCTACVNICPQSAISMVSDDEGFLYPQIKESECIHCGLCIKVCGFRKRVVFDKKDVPIVIAAKNANDIDRMKSQSGGMFRVLSNYVFENGGVVYGAGFGKNWNVIHKRAVNPFECEEFSGSKYVQSILNNCYKQVENDLQFGKLVLFSGTTCQCLGLRNYLKMKGISSDRLILVDIVCHGVPSPKIWQLYCNYMKEKHNGNIEAVNFRNKIKYGWNSHVETLMINGHSYDTEVYKDLFYGHNALRPSCYYCPYKSINHETDITIGDFWGIDVWAPEFNDNKGISLVLINSVKGRNVFEAIKEKIEYKKSNVKAFLQPPLMKPFPEPNERTEFWKDVYTQKFTYVLGKYTKHYGWKYRSKKAIKSFFQIFINK